MTTDHDEYLLWLNTPTMRLRRAQVSLTDLEIQREWLNRRETRLLDLCGSAPPTSEQLEIATKEADQWRTDYLSGQMEELLF